MKAVSLCVYDYCMSLECVCTAVVDLPRIRTKPTLWLWDPTCGANVLCVMQGRHRGLRLKCRRLVQQEYHLQKYKRNTGRYGIDTVQ